MTTLIHNVFIALEQVVLQVKNTQTGLVEIVEGSCDWFTELFPQSSRGASFIITEDTPFIHDFLIDARKIWRDNKNGKVTSGFWTEITKDNGELHLEAIAIKQNNQNILIITNQFEEFKHRQNTLQSARELLISNDQLIQQNEYLHSRLLTILKKPENQHSILLALTKTIENAGFAVLITSDTFDTIIENSTASNLFKESNNANSQNKSIEVILNLMKNQLPEFDRIVETTSTWDGELCWMSPPASLKWLKISLFPVKDGLGKLKNWIVFANDISNIKYLMQRNEQLVLRDLLTELPNRFSFWQTLEKQIENRTPFYLLYVDINDFRRLNEFYGHEEGDKLLIDVSKRIKNVIKDSGNIARVGGDEFAVILSDVNSQASCEEFVQHLFNSTLAPFFTSESDSFNISLSIGAASYPNDAETVEELMKFVDLSAYNGKKNKQNSLQFYSQSMKEASRHVIEIENDLRHGIKNNEFELYLQPIIDLETNKIMKAEALIRWNHPQKGMINPDEFISIAEKSDLIIGIGNWVIKSACIIAKTLAEKGHKIKISMNLSPLQVLDENLFSHIHSCVKKYKVDPCLLELEVTEGVLVDDYSVTSRLLGKIRAIGMSVSVDDFGTGFSSLAHLKKLPLDYLKIDRSFVQDLAVDENDKAIVRAVIAMAHNLHLGVIAEGVETSDQLAFLSQNSCNSVQGFYFSQPVKLSELTKLIAKQKN